MNVSDDIFDYIISFVGNNYFAGCSTVSYKFWNSYKKSYGATSSIMKLNSFNISVIQLYLKQLTKLKINSQKKLGLLVATSDNCDLINMYVDAGLAIDKKFIKIIIKKNYYHILDKICTQIKNKLNHYCNDAAYHGHLDCLKRLHKNNFPLTEKALYNAGVQKHYACINYLIENQCNISNELFIKIIRDNDVDFLKYLHKKGCIFNDNLCYTSIFYNNIKCLTYLHEVANCKLSSSLCNLAIRTNNFDSLNYCISKNCEWIYDKVVLNNEDLFLKFTKYIIEKNRVLPANIFEDAANKNYIKCLKLLITNKVYHNEQKFIIDRVIEQANKYETLVFVVNNGLYHEIPKQNGQSVFNIITERCTVEKLQYLHANSFAITESSAIKCVFVGNYDCFKYIFELKQNKCNWYNSFYIAQQMNRFDIIKLICSRSI